MLRMDFVRFEANESSLPLLAFRLWCSGQKSRLAFAVICWRQPHVLILDEPTNHLDMDTIDVLIRAVQEFKGAVLIISHDQYFLSNTVKEFWSINARRLKIYDNLESCKKATYKIQAAQE
jgi:ATP-binding cassette subfamily F protein 3